MNSDTSNIRASKRSQIGAPQGNTRFANIMREIAEAHDGVLILKPRI